MDYFAEANAKIVELENKIAALENADPVDLSALISDLEAVKAAVGQLDARLDAMSIAAQG
jgi:hypothetical protein